MEKSRVQWSDLPPELWPLIGKRLETYIDVLRFRSVCRSWRASLPPYDADSPLSPDLDFSSLIVLPHRHRHRHRHRADGSFLHRRIIYGFTPLHHHPTSSSSSSDWCARVEGTTLRKLQSSLDLSLHLSVQNDEKAVRNDVNFLDFRIYEIAKSYGLETAYGAPVPGITKVVIPPTSAWTDLRTCTIVAVHGGGKLGFAKYGDAEWRLIDDNNFHYDDVFVYKGQMYAVDKWGTVFWIDSSMKLVQFSVPSCGFGDLKHLVECGGELYVVDRFLCKSDTNSDSDNRNGVKRPEVIDLKVYRLDQDWGRWEDVKYLGNRAFFLGKDCCFSVSASDFEGIEANCIYFNNSESRRKSFSSGRFSYSFGFDLKEGRISQTSIGFH